MNPKIFEISKTEMKLIEENASRGLELCKSLLNISSSINFSLLDKAFAKLSDKRNEVNLNNDEIAEELGCYFGKLLQEEFNLSWQNIEDKHGQEKALIDEKTGNVIFPIVAVLKRLEPNHITEPFFEAMAEVLKKHLNFLAKSADN